MATSIIIREVSKLSELEQIRTTCTESLKGGLAIGCGATAGSLMLGPVGLFVGGALASALISWRKMGSYKSLVTIISEDLTPKQKEQLVDSLQEALSQFNREDLLRLILMIGSGGAQAAVREVVICTVKEFAVQELGLQLA